MTVGQFIKSYLIISNHSAIAHLMFIVIQWLALSLHIWEVGVFVLGQGAGYPVEGSHGLPESYQDHLGIIL